ncbi:MFS transporter [Caenibacillus caldisaponilyticus]|uniref:MFS transporter n=1 Tax=Caenibacillus caldisaponilyticus TaxID=1674942 RepID=UPI0009888D58|nr:MFS transporter [Caenibacillus caldisaponilyticus]
MNAQTRATGSKKVAYSSGHFAIQLMSQAFATYIVFYYADVLNVPPAWLSFAMVLHGMVNALWNPIFGYLSDHTQSRWGRRTPYIAIGFAPLAASFALLWCPFVPSHLIFGYFLVAVLIYDTLFVLVVLNWTALYPEMYPDLKTRTEVSSWRQMFGLVGMIVGVALPPLIYGSVGWPAMGILFGVLVGLVFAFTLTGIRENPRMPNRPIPLVQALRDALVNRSFIWYVAGSFFAQLTFALLPAALPFFSKYVLHISDAEHSAMLGAIFLTAIPCVYLWGKAARRFGPRKTALAATGLLLIALLPFAAIRTFAFGIVTSAGVGVGLAGLIVLLDVMLAEIIDEDEKRTGLRREGLYFGVNGFIVRWSVSLQAVIMGWMLASTGYSARQTVQPEAALWGFRLLLSAVPIAFLLLSLLCFYLYPIGKTPSSTTNSQNAS